MREMFITFEELEEMELHYKLEDNGLSGKYPGHHWYTAYNETDKNARVIEIYVK